MSLLSVCSTIVQTHCTLSLVVNLPVRLNAVFTFLTKFLPHTLGLASFRFYNKLLTINENSKVYSKTWGVVQGVVNTKS